VDDLKFDRLTRLFSTAESRRSAIRVALGAVFGVALLDSSAGPHAGAEEFTERDASADGTFAGGGNGAGTLGGGRSGGNRKRRNRRGANRGNDSRKRKLDDKCAKAGELRKDGKPCCKGLYRDVVDRCIRPQTSDGSPGGGGSGGGGCDPKSCPSDPVTRKAGFCCPAGFCSCGDGCCSSPDCWIYTESSTFGEQIISTSKEYCSQEEAGCVPCPSADGTCCIACVNGECVPSTQRRATSIRRR
jgi:hypothetical protein